jgi:hypothetical protein
MSIDTMINEDRWVRSWVVSVAFELDNPRNVEELPLLLLACQAHGTSNIFCSSETQLAVCAFFQPVQVERSTGEGMKAGEPAAGMVHRRDAAKSCC